MNNKNENISEIRPTIVVHAKMKPRLKQRVKYIFRNDEDEQPQNNSHSEKNEPNESNESAQDKNLSSIFLEKEKIRSLITPNPDAKE